MNKIYNNVDISVLVLEYDIANSGSQELKDKIISLSLSGSQLTAEVDEDFSALNDTELANLISSNDKEFEIPYFKIYDLCRAEHVTDKYSLPFDIDFKTMLTTKLKKKTLTKNHGKPTKCEYYEHYDKETQEYSNIICETSFSLFYDVGGFIEDKQVVLKWYRTDGSLSSEFKDIGRAFHPILDNEARIAEGKTRRAAIIDGMQLGVLSALIQTEPWLENETVDEKTGRMILIGRGFLVSHDVEFEQFVRSSEKQIITTIATDSHPEHAWLDNQVPAWGNVKIRDYILNELNI